jgi:copper chaperone CopZ
MRVITRGRAAMPANAATTHLAVRGMTCVGCVNAVTRVLARVAGAANVRVDLDAGRADIDGSAAADDLVAAVRKAGFEAEPLAA